MQPDTRASDLERIVLEWQGPIYNLALRMLGNEADAADATQEVFLRVFRKLHRFDRSRELKPWVFRVAIHAIRNFDRRARTRRRKETDSVRMKDKQGAGEDSLDRAERERLVAEGLSRIDVEERAVLLLRYQSGLSQAEVAEVLGVSRTTAQARLTRAEDSLRRALRGCGALAALAAASDLEAAIGTLPTVAVPASVSAALLQSAAAASAITKGSIILGGVVMTKKAILVAAALGLLCLGGGFWAGKVVEGGAAGVSPVEIAKRYVPRAEHEEALGKLGRTSRELEAARKELERHRKAERRSAKGVAASAGDPAAAAPEASANEETAAPDVATVDWSHLADLSAQHLDLLAKMARHEKLTQDEESTLLEIQLELMRCVKEARKLSDYPLLDDRIFPGLLESLAAKPLGLSDAQLSELRAIFPAMKESLEHFDPETATPPEIYRQRLDLIERYREAMDKLVTDEQRASWEKLKLFSGGLLEGSRGEFVLPWAPDESDGTQREMLRRWKESYGLDEAQAGRLGPLASDLYDQAGAILEKHGQLAEPKRKLDEAESQRMQREFLDIQIEKEKELQRMLTPQQVAALRGAVPFLLRFAQGNRNWADRRGGMGL